jgi:von Willebrand factor type D domain
MVKPRLKPNESPVIRYRLTNVGASCTVVTSPAFALHIAALTRDRRTRPRRGRRPSAPRRVAVTPSLARAPLIDGYVAAVRASQRTVARGASVTLLLRATRGRAHAKDVSIETFDSTESTHTSSSTLWAVNGAGTFALALIYRSFPVTAGASQACLAPLRASRVRFHRMTSSGGSPVHQSVDLSAAQIRPLSGTSSAYNECARKFGATGGDPDGVFQRVSGQTEDRIDLLPGRGFEEHYRPGLRDNYGTIKWDTRPPQQQVRFSDGVQAEKCSSLYHELAHRDQQKNKRDDGRTCIADGKDTGIPIDEVEATRSENRYRAGQGLPQRTKYGGRALPSGPCTGPPPPTPQCKSDAGCGGVSGDPHMRTGDGHAYDFQGHGEFDALVDVRRPDELRLQLRMSPYGASRVVSVVSAVAMTVSGTRLGFYQAAARTGPQVRRDGALWHLSIGATALAHGASIERTPQDAFTVRWADGTEVELTSRSWGYDVSVATSALRRGEVVGLLGNFDGNVTNDLTTRNGRTLPRDPSFEVLYRLFGDSWRLTAATSLFDYPAGRSTESYTDRSFPDRAVRAADLPNTRGAEELCRAAGITERQYLADCVLDVTLTGDAAFADAAASAQSATALHGFHLVTRGGPDRVGPGDGRLEPDGVADAVFAVRLEGVIADVILTVCDASGTPTGHHWDTIAGTRPIPPGYAFASGHQTWTLGVYADGIRLSNADGSISKVFDRPTSLDIHVQDDGGLTKGAHVCLAVFGSDGAPRRFQTKLP